MSYNSPGFPQNIDLKLFKLPVRSVDLAGAEKYRVFETKDKCEQGDRK
jgi:hypothetical protein